MPKREVGIGSEIAVIWAVSGSTWKRVADDDVAEVEGAGDRRDDDGEGERGAVVGAGQVGAAGGGVEGGRAGAGAGGDVADAGRRRGQEGLAIWAAPVPRSWEIAARAASGQ